MSTQNFRKTFVKIISYFTVWRVMIFLVAAVSVLVIPEFKPSFPYHDRILVFTKLPQWIWRFGNFDGVYYLRIARWGYVDNFEQAFFPLFPMLIRFVTKINIFLPIEKGIAFPQYIEAQYFQNAMLFTNAIFLIALFYTYKLFRLDWSKKVSMKSILLLLLFPTAFFFGSVYTESLFLLLAVVSIYLARKEKYLLSGIFASLASATRIIGILLLPVLLIEVYKNRKNIMTKTNLKISTFLGVIIAPLGLIIYMFYLNNNFGDPIYFLNAQPFFGAGRSSLPVITLPQVVFRYIKMLLTIPVDTKFVITLFELIFGTVPLFFVLLNYRKIRFSYLTFIATALIIPTLTGTFSSMPRYALVSFLALPLVAKMRNKYFVPIALFFILIQILFVSLFVGGIWVS